MSKVVKSAIKKFLGRQYQVFIALLETLIQSAEEELQGGKREHVVTKAQRWLESHGIKLPGWALNLLVEIIVAEMNAANIVKEKEG